MNVEAKAILPSEYKSGSDFVYSKFGSLVHLQIGSQELVIAAPKEAIFTHSLWFSQFKIPPEYRRIFYVHEETVIFYANFHPQIYRPPKPSGSPGSKAEYFFDYPFNDRQGRLLGQYMPPAHMHNGEANASLHGHEGSEDYNWVKGELVVETSKGIQVLNELNPYIHVPPFIWHQAKNFTNEPSIAIIRCNFNEHIRDLSQLH